MKRMKPIFRTIVIAAIIGLFMMACKTPTPPVPRITVPAPSVTAPAPSVTVEDTETEQNQDEELAAHSIDDLDASDEDLDAHGIFADSDAALDWFDTYGNILDLTAAIDEFSTFTVTFNTNSDTVIPALTSIEHNTKIESPDPPIRTGFESKFLGWYKEIDFKNAWDFYNDTVSSDITLYAKWGPYEIGETGPGGGTIFFRSQEGFTMLDDNSIAHYLEAAPSNAVGGIGTQLIMRWQTQASPPYPDVRGTSPVIGAGRKNTALIIAVDTASNPETTYISAAKAANNYFTETANDWFLPSLDELIEIYNQRNHLNIGPLWFWSSTQFNTTSAWSQNIFNGFRNDNHKYLFNNVRPIRAF
ncbi:MAG: InlB B-repeat-containing protein [Spirochaetaceae bacterium]|nr:InlB B-repeat-containing protein [Spirochaetaceae bacterium]